MRCFFSILVSCSFTLGALAADITNMDHIRGLIVQDIAALEEPACLQRKIRESQRHLALISTGCSIEKVIPTRWDDRIDLLFTYKCTDSESFRPNITFSCALKR